MTFTAETITTAALAFNAEYPEAAAEIQAGTPKVRVHLSNGDNYGRTIIAAIHPGIVAEDGGWIGTGDEFAKTLRRFDGRLTRTEIARRASKFLGLSGVSVPVEFVEHGC